MTDAFERRALEGSKILHRMAELPRPVIRYTDTGSPPPERDPEYEGALESAVIVIAVLVILAIALLFRSTGG